MTPASDRPVIRRSRGERRVTYALKVLALLALGATIVSAIVDFLGRISSVAGIIIGAVFFTYVIYPLVRRLNARMPLVAAILLVYLGIVAIVAFAVSFIVPALVNDTQSLVKATPQIVHNAQGFISNPRDPILKRLPDPVRAYLTKVPAQIAALAEQYAGAGASRVLTLVVSVVGLIATVVVIPVLSVYVMIEAPGLIGALLRALPLGVRPQALSVLHDLDTVLGGFIRGQLLVGATIGTCITIALLILHVKYAVLIGVAAGLFDVIPYVGALVGFVPSVLLALFNDGWQHALIVALVFVGIFQAEGHFIAPKIVSDSVGLSPLMVIVAILIGGELNGITGMFLAVPIAGVLRVILLHALPRLRTPLPPAAPPPVAEGPRPLAGMQPPAKAAQSVRA